MATFVREGAPFRYLGLSTDVKPVGVEIGSLCFETDTGKTFITADGTNWTEFISTEAI